MNAPARQRSDVLAGRRPVLEALRAGQPLQRVLVARGLAPSAVIGEIRRRAAEVGTEVRLVAPADVDRAAPGLHHQGVVALTGRYRYAALSSMLSAAAPILFLDGVMDPHNLGSLLRSADGAGFAGVVLPERRAAGVTAAVRRVSAGAAEVVPVARVTNLSRALDEARTSGLWAAGLDPRADDDIWTSSLLDPPVALVLGAEDRGIAPAVRNHCDGFVRIPASGRLGSLNVASAGAVAMFEVARRIRAAGEPPGAAERAGSTLGRKLE